MPAAAAEKGLYKLGMGKFVALQNLALDDMHELCFRLTD